MFFKRSGLQDWLIQRFTAVYLTVYFFYLISFWFFHAPLTYEVWFGCFQAPAMKVATMLALVAIIAHAWLGIWTVLTDYIKPYCLRILLQGLVIASLLACGAWGMMILWGGV